MAEARSRTQALRRLMRELNLVRSEPSWGVSAMPISDDDIFTWHCNVAGRPPEGGAPVILHLELTFPDDYPLRPPRVEVLGSTVHHPNVFSTFICLDMLEGGEWAADEEKQRPYSGWSSAYSILAILRQLQTFFFEGDGTRWWACGTCTLHNEIQYRRCQACETPRREAREIVIQVEHAPGFRCRCGHTHDGAPQPSFPDPTECDDAPLLAVVPEGCPEDSCVICLGDLREVPARGPLRGAPGGRPLGRLVDSAGAEVCPHWFHLPCARELQGYSCPMCRTPFAEVREYCRPSFLEVSPTAADAEEAEDEQEPSLPASRGLRGAALGRMARLSEWPLHAVLEVMSRLRRPDRAALARAVPAWQEAAQAPMFWEAQEVQCFHEKIGPDEDVIGIGVLAEGKGRLATLRAHFDAVSCTAWKSGLRRAAWKEPMTHWLPLFVHRAHATAAAPLLRECLAELASCAPQEDDSHMPHPVFASLAKEYAPQVAVDAVVALPEMMHGLLKQVLDGDRHASMKVLKGYFVLHRLFLHCCDEWPAIRNAADAALRHFLASEENRTRRATPWLAYLLPLLSVSNVGWGEVKQAFLEESLARTVPFILRQYPGYRPAPTAEEPAAAEAAAAASAAWVLTEDFHASEKLPGTQGAEQIAPDCWKGRPRGWCRLLGAERDGKGRQGFEVRILRLPRGSVVRIGWITDPRADELVGTTADGWGYYASPNVFGGGGWLAHRGLWTRASRGFAEGDVVTACVDRGLMRFLVNGHLLHEELRGPELAFYSPAVALSRQAEVQLVSDRPVDLETCFATPQQLRNMAWSARLAVRGNKLVMFQAFFLRLVRGDGLPDWEAVKREFDLRLGFPAPHMADALFDHFAEVHRVAGLTGCEAWPLFLKCLGFDDVTDDDLDAMLVSAYERATNLGYRIPSGHGQYA